MARYFERYICRLLVIPFRDSDEWKCIKMKEVTKYTWYLTKIKEKGQSGWCWRPTFVKNYARFGEIRVEKISPSLHNYGFRAGFNSVFLERMEYGIASL